MEEIKVLVLGEESQEKLQTRLGEQWILLSILFKLLTLQLVAKPKHGERITLQQVHD